CAPCISDIEDSQDAKEFVAQQDVEYVYIAIGDKEPNWNNAAERLGIERNQFMLLDSKTSPLNTYLLFTGIPRYIILNGEHKIINGNAPRPTSTFLNDFKISVNKCFEKTITY
ncbi:MAG: hypothetical protein LBR64_08785, partial [Dysgonamonadaceae bacterium]|nr:hypothetical protein [Dysgonamonadaceae bacterium]